MATAIVIGVIAGASAAALTTIGIATAVAIGMAHP